MIAGGAYDFYDRIGDSFKILALFQQPVYYF